MTEPLLILVAVVVGVQLSNAIDSWWVNRSVRKLVPTEAPPPLPTPQYCKCEDPETAYAIDSLSGKSILVCMDCHRRISRKLPGRVEEGND